MGGVQNERTSHFFRLGFTHLQVHGSVIVAIASSPAPVSDKPARQMPHGDGDLVRSYLRDIGRVPLLSHEQEITLCRQVQELMAIEEQ